MSHPLEFYTLVRVSQNIFSNIQVLLARFPSIIDSLSLSLGYAFQKDTCLLVLLQTTTLALSVGSLQMPCCSCPPLRLYGISFHLCKNLPKCAVEHGTLFSFRRVTTLMRVDCNLRVGFLLLLLTFRVLFFHITPSYLSRIF